MMFGVLQSYLTNGTVLFVTNNNNLDTQVINAWVNGGNTCARQNN